MTAVLVDSHCHLYLLDGSAGELVAQARAEGIGHVVDVGVDLASSERVAADAAACEHLSATAGIHPHDAVQLDQRALGRLRELLARPRVVAVGETGLDYHYDNSPRPVQRDAFAAHVRLACELDKALVVHCREAWDDALTILAREGPPARVVFHCFTGNRPIAERVLAAGYHVSFSGTVTFKNAQAQRDACAIVPLERMLLETDSPFLSPHPYRGRPNRPGRVALTAATVAAVHGLPVSAVAEATSRTAARVFRLPPTVATEPR
jgi:TatD DNase family protein